jgi:alpha-glucosidase (family GH31 glycosyl hydrolase)
MNEATGFCDGECPGYTPPASSPKQLTEEDIFRRDLHAELEIPDVIDSSWYFSYQYQKAPSTYYLPFIPGYDNSGNLDNMAISLNATHSFSGAIGDFDYTEYNVHNLFGHMMAMYTQYFLQSTIQSSTTWNDRPFVLSRSTFAGSG